MTTITSLAWWKAAVLRALRTALVIAVPYLGGSALGAVPWVTIGSAALLGFIASLLTSLAGLPELGSGAPFWLALLERTVKTLAQSLAAGIGQTLLFQDVDWSTVVQTSLIATLGTLVLAVISKLPETKAPIVATGDGTTEDPAVITSAAPAKKVTKKTAAKASEKAL